jgi:hypothetical protein
MSGRFVSWTVRARVAATAARTGRLRSGPASTTTARLRPGTSRTAAETSWHADADGAAGPVGPRGRRRRRRLPRRHGRASGLVARALQRGSVGQLAELHGADRLVRAVGRGLRLCEACLQHLHALHLEHRPGRHEAPGCGRGLRGASAPVAVEAFAKPVHGAQAVMECSAPYPMGATACAQHPGVGRSRPNSTGARRGYDLAKMIGRPWGS